MRQLLNLFIHFLTHSFIQFLDILNSECVFYIHSLTCARWCLMLQYQPVSIQHSAWLRILEKILPYQEHVSGLPFPAPGEHPALPGTRCPLPPSLRNQSWRHWVRNLGTNCHSSGITRLWDAWVRPGIPVGLHQPAVLGDPSPAPAPLSCSPWGNQRGQVTCWGEFRSGAGGGTERSLSVHVQTSGWAAKPLETGSTAEDPEWPPLSSKLCSPPSPKHCFALTFIPVWPCSVGQIG